MGSNGGAGLGNNSHAQIYGIPEIFRRKISGETLTFFQLKGRDS